MFMGVVDTIMVGPLGPEAIGAVSVGGILFDVVGITAIGLILGLDALVSQAFGGGRLQECNGWLWQALYLSAISTPVLMLIIAALPFLLAVTGVNAGVSAIAIPYIHALNLSLPPLVVYAVLRRYLQGMSLVRPVMFALVSANGVNAAGNWLLIDPFGVEGVGYATCLARIYMGAFLAVVAIAGDRTLLRNLPKPNAEAIRRLLSLGLPAAGQIVLEIGVFATATILAGRLAPYALAAHHIVLNCAATTFMVPLGVSSAGAVSVGQALGRGDAEAARRAGWISISLGAGFMLVAAGVLVSVPGHIVAIFTADSGVRSVAIPLLFVVAAFQISDGTQVTATGVLRGAGDTRTPMLVNLMGHWLLGLPAGYFLCFVLGFGVNGLWMGLSLGLIVVSVLLLVVWSRLPLRATLPQPASSTAS
jgi:MATE family multidrug resistance protein